MYEAQYCYWETLSLTNSFAIQKYWLYSKDRLIIGIFSYIIFIFVCIYTLTFTNADACMPDAHAEFRGQAQMSMIAFHLLWDKISFAFSLRLTVWLVQELPGILRLQLPSVGRSAKITDAYAASYGMWFVGFKLRPAHSLDKHIAHWPISSDLASFKGWISFLGLGRYWSNINFQLNRKNTLIIFMVQHN